MCILMIVHGSLKHLNMLVLMINYVNLNVEFIGQMIQVFVGFGRLENR